ncbi:MAG TPA: hypothetical protein VND65_06615 [Candidatus Binatia bacterium]|nr:hypothetical protein [Candidatus Binatia bacterium]
MKWRMGWRQWPGRWKEGWARLAPRCQFRACAEPAGAWRRLRERPRAVELERILYSHTACLERGLVELMESAPFARSTAPAGHRVPLGLLMLSRQQITAENLRTALARQRAGGRGKIGEWLRELGFATEAQVTAALARQWSCPVLKVEKAAIAPSRFPAIPTLLLQTFAMVPVELVEATKTLLMAFSEGIDYSVLYAIERMLGYRTEACLACPSLVEKSLEALARRRIARDVVFDRIDNRGESARIVASYAARMKAERLRLARCGAHFWIRLERGREEGVNLVLRG